MRIFTIIAGLMLVFSFLGADEAEIAPGQGLAGPTSGIESVPVKEKPMIEVVFVLDTTGSMGGLIEAAYRDKRDAYITRITPLSNDLDAVYKDLMKLRAGGGGDTPESVNQALHEAVTKIKWSRNTRTYQVIFLVGDCPPHMDYKDDIKYPQTCIRAAKAGIIINTIQCGQHKRTQPIWGDIAKRSEGNYFRVEQSGSAILASTPFDTELAELSRELDDTRIFYGQAKVKNPRKSIPKLRPRRLPRGRNSMPVRRVNIILQANRNSSKILSKAKSKLRKYKPKNFPSPCKR